MAGSLGRWDGGSRQWEQAAGRVLRGGADAEMLWQWGPALLGPGEFGVPAPLSDDQDLSQRPGFSLGPTPVNNATGLMEPDLTGL